MIICNNWRIDYLNIYTHFLFLLLLTLNINALPSHDSFTNNRVSHGYPVRSGYTLLCYSCNSATCANNYTLFTSDSNDSHRNNTPSCIEIKLLQCSILYNPCLDKYSNAILKSENSSIIVKYFQDKQCKIQLTNTNSNNSSEPNSIKQNCSQCYPGMQEYICHTPSNNTLPPIPVTIPKTPINTNNRVIINDTNGNRNNLNKTKVFVVYGHDLEARDNVERMLIDMNCLPIILDKIPSGGAMTIMEKLEENMDVEFGIVIMSHDNHCYVKDEATGHLVPSAYPRLNVVFEFGMLVGRLGRKKTLYLELGSNTASMMSDIAGVNYIRYKDDLQNLRLEVTNLLNKNNILKILYIYGKMIYIF
ncbi:hypothetical protein CYY_003659 [Polysphondylium violaceum]|uniref:CD-NTase-associated protein 12/Pycsar effector protein TIR domain-containing protein n=1 Tax=Polysphondylium violaceum TaxID=133409 RepID=A0A8J4PY42_9MYCE|nr:hypothetical protein CYY_003659 [Polysphondylium violaceum]